ncbi:MAG: YkgJ family cysteine cluster protein [Planctomycetes bacterium]|nr:YkgJ family cysteine cluster protein [Planctomycetota bacterium]
MTQPESESPPPGPTPAGSRWYEAGLCFSCTACGNCCKSNGEYSHVYVTSPEITELARFLGVSETQFRAERIQEEDGWTTLVMEGPDCFFLDEKGHCRVYPVRPRQCRSWPFWEENLKPGVWQGPMKEICPGLDSGPRVSADEIDRIARANEEWYESDGRSNG